MDERLEGWLAGFEEEDGVSLVSAARRFHHDEEAYDAQYENDPLYMGCGHGLSGLVRELGLATDRPALEIGCGTGVLTLGLTDANPYPLLVASDPSPAFLRIARNKLRRAELDLERVRFAVMRAEDIAVVPDGSLSMVTMRSTLHHILDVDAFLAEGARTLSPGGALAFSQEPCLEGYVLMGALGQLLPVAAEAGGSALTDEQRAEVDRFVLAMHYYARRDVDKSEAEDKHLFRTDELHQTAGRLGLEMTYIANMSFDHFRFGPEERPEPDVFGPFMRTYLQYAMGASEGLLEAFDRWMAPHCRFLDDLAPGGTTPHIHGVFVFRKP